MTDNIPYPPPPQMVTIRQCAATGILPEHSLRTLVKLNRIPHIMVGNTAYINYTMLVEQLNGLTIL